MPDITDAQTIVETAQEAVALRETPGAPGIYYVHDRFSMHDLHETLAKRLPRPARKRGTFAFTDPAGLTRYLDKHALAETELYADVDKGTITAVINAHDGDTAATGEVSSDAGWGDHRAILTLRRTDDWEHWTKADTKWFPQTAFAEYIEQHLPNFVTPDGATMLELAQTFKATKAVKFEQSKRLKSGETKLEYREDIEAKAGARGSLDIPDEITLALAPFEHGAPYKVTARLRYRIDGGELALSYVLIRPRDILLDAFNAVIEDVGGGSDRDIWHGTSG